MLVLPYIYHALASFRQVFSRHRTWVLFCLVVLALLGLPHIEGITSVCRFWNLEEAGYHSLLRLFHSTAWNVRDLMVQWQCFVVEQKVGVFVDGRQVLLGDHTEAVKDGRRMPGVVTLHQHSETQSKPSYFRGHHWGFVGMLCGTLEAAFCVPLAAQIQQGRGHLLENEEEESKPDTLGVRLVRLAVDYALRHDTPCTLVLDAFFSTGSVFTLAHSFWSIAIRQPYVHIITRAKKSYVAYFEATRSSSRKRGRPKKYGPKIKLTDVFVKYKGEFRKVRCKIYGNEEEISCKALNLLWKPIAAPVRFVFAVTSRGPIVLMCSDMNIDPLTAVSLYCSRVRIETLFAMLKGLLNVFCYRFWSKKLPPHSRKPLKNSSLKKPRREDVACVRRTWEASERFVLLGCIAEGLLQLVSLKFGSAVWGSFRGYLRTRSRSLPSEWTVREVAGAELLKDFHSVAPSAMMQQIRPGGQRPEKSAQISHSDLPAEQLTG